MINRMSDIAGDILCVMLVIFIICFAYKAATDVEDDDSDAVTITYSCNTVLSNSGKYDSFLVQQCLELKDRK